MYLLSVCVKSIHTQLIIKKENYTEEALYKLTLREPKEIIVRIKTKYIYSLNRGDLTKLIITLQNKAPKALAENNNVKTTSSYQPNNTLLISDYKKQKLQILENALEHAMCITNIIEETLVNYMKELYDQRN